MKVSHGDYAKKCDPRPVFIRGEGILPQSAETKPNRLGFIIEDTKLS